MTDTTDPRVQKTVEEYLSGVAGVRGALVVAVDGLPLCSHGLDDERVEHWAAMAAALMGVARRAVEQAKGGGIRQLVVDMHDGHILLDEAGADGALLVVTAADAELATVGPEVERVAERLRGILGADAPAGPAQPDSPAGQSEPAAGKPVEPAEAPAR
jgi:hypothetical protein